MTEIRPFPQLSGSALQDAQAVKEGLDWFGTQFGDFSTVNRRTLVDVESHYPLSEQSNVTDTTDASITSTTSDAEVHIQTDATANANALVETSEIGRYTAGFVAECGIGVRVPSLPTGEQTARWGYFSNGEGLYFGVDADGIFVARSRGGQENKTYQQNWDIDIMDGSQSNERNPSGKDLDLSEGHIYRIVFAWYGYGEIRYEILTSDENGRQEPIPVHREVYFGETSVKNPNQPVSVEVSNNATASSFDLYLGGRQFAIYGDTNSNRRIKSQAVFSTSLEGTTWTPLVTLRRKSDFEDVRIDFLSYDIIPSDNIAIQVREDATLTGASYQTPTNVKPGETAVEVDTTASAVDATTGRQRFQALHSSGSGTNQEVGGRDDIELRLRRRDELTLMARKISGSGGTASVVAKWKEEW